MFDEVRKFKICQKVMLKFLNVVLAPIKQQHSTAYIYTSIQEIIKGIQEALQEN